MENTIAQPHAKRQMTKKQLRTILVVIFLILAALFAYFFFRGQDLGSSVLNQIGPTTQPKPLFGIYGSGTVGPMVKPMAVTVSNRKVYISDTGNHRVAVFDYDGNPLYAFGKQGKGKGQFGFPYGVTVDNSGQVYVADLYNGNIQVFSSDGKFIKYFADKKNKAVGQPAGLYFYDNTIFVTDVQYDKVFAFDLTGKKILEFGGQGSRIGQFMAPNDITVTKDYIIVADSGNDRVQIFNRSGKFVAINNGFNDPSKKSAFVNTRGVGVDGRGTLYVVSNITDKVFGFAKDGSQPFLPFGSLGKGNDQFSLPNGLFIDNEGRIYIADSINQRVMVYQN